MTEPRQPRRTAAGDSEAEAAAPADALRYLTIQELSARTTLSVSTLRRLLKKGKLVGHQPGGPRTRIVFRPDAIEQATTAMVADATGVPPHPQPVSIPQHGPRPKWQQAK
ncbi:MAG TPA: helix-turn-helix domain-containing protein [Gemmataceae bacterium]|nr:helix-turn-helix domain-containing protein [Gemmataceae bacterium]